MFTSKLSKSEEKNPMALSCAWTTVCRPLDTEKSLCYTHNERCCWSWTTRRRNFGNKIIVLYANRQLLLTLTVDAVGQKWCDEKLKKRALLWPFKSTATAVTFGIQESGAKMIMKKYKIWMQLVDCPRKSYWSVKLLHCSEHQQMHVEYLISIRQKK